MLSSSSAVAEDFATRVLGANKAWLAITIPAGSSIAFERWQLRSVTLSGPLAFDDLAFPAGTDLTFGDSGALSHVTCPEPIELCGIRWAAFETVSTSPGARMGDDGAAARGEVRC